MPIAITCIPTLKAPVCFGKNFKVSEKKSEKEHGRVVSSRRTGKGKRRRGENEDKRGMIVVYGSSKVITDERRMIYFILYAGLFHFSLFLEV